MIELKSFGIFLVCFFVLIICNYSFISNVFADEGVNVSNTEGKSIRHQIILDENLIYFVWEDHTFEKPDIFFSKSTDSGQSFSKSINVSNTTGASLWPRFAVSDNDVYVTWYDYTPGISDVYFSHSSDGGLNFETINLSENIGVSFNSWISTSGNDVYIVWMDETPNHIPVSIDKPHEEIDVYLGGTDVLLATSHDKGQTFEITNLSKNPVESSAPRLAVLENNIYVAWIQATANGDQVYFTKSSDAGFTFTKPVDISNGVNAINAGILVNDNNVYLTWIGQVEEHSDIFFTQSRDGGDTFDATINISHSDENSSKNRDTHMASSGNNIYLVWTDKTGNHSEVYFVKSNDSQNFSDPVNLNYLGNDAKYVEVVAHLDNVHVMWDDPSSNDVFLRTSNDGGQNFQSIKNLSNDEPKSALSILGPHLAVSDMGVYVGWSSDGDQTKDTLLKFIEHNPDRKILFLETDNQLVNIEIKMIQEEQESNTQTTFNLNFTDAKTKQLLENVHYSFYIEDSSGNEVVSKLDQIADTGQDTQVVNFQKTEYVNLIINVTGLGLTQPYDTSYSGVSSAVITAIPEFPFGAFVLLGLMIVPIIILKTQRTLKI